MNITNTLGKNKEVFKPQTPGKVSMYHCGPTLYWTQQIGNMYAMVQADVIRRSFIANGFDVTFVRNYTDVGHLSGDNEGDADSGQDRMEKAAQRESKSPEEIAQHYREEFDRHTDLLNIQKPTYAPMATDHIQEMITFVQGLLDKGFAYQTNLAIYFDISKARDYNKLSGQKIESLQSGSGHGSVTDTEKKNQQDFALWFFKTGSHQNALQTWPNPFSELPGFPGWHIECSALIENFLGETIDVHMGGVEHIPIHHTNEIAQSESLHEKPLAHYWIHNEHLLVDGQKMSKSLGNAINLNHIIEKGFNPLDLRYFFLQAHYRSKINFTWQALEASQTALRRLRGRIQAFPKGGSVHEQYLQEFLDRINDDFNVPAGLAYVTEVLQSDISDAQKRATVLKFDEVFGLDLDKETGGQLDIPNEVAELLEQREKARLDKNFELSDHIREQISSHGYEVLDAPDGQQIKKL